MKTITPAMALIALAKAELPNPAVIVFNDSDPG